MTFVLPPTSPEEEKSLTHTRSRNSKTKSNNIVQRARINNYISEKRDRVLNNIIKIRIEILGHINNCHFNVFKDFISTPRVSV